MSCKEGLGSLVRNLFWSGEILKNIRYLLVCINVVAFFKNQVCF